MSDSFIIFYEACFRFQCLNWLTEIKTFLQTIKKQSFQTTIIGFNMYYLDLKKANNSLKLMRR